MDIRIEPLKRDDLDEFIKTYWYAFEPLSANMIMPMIYPKGLQPDLMDCMRQRSLRQTNGDLGSTCFVARDATSGKIVGVSRWVLEEDPPKTPDEIDTKFDEGTKARQEEPAVEGMNSELNEAYQRAAFYSELETVVGRPYMTLRLLAVHPSHQRRGVGSLLIKPLLEKADRLSLPVYLDTGVSGKPLYERLGFEVTSDFPLNALDYGGRSDGRHWCMMRPVQGR